MCGIGLVLEESGLKGSSLLSEALVARGPDSSEVVSIPGASFVGSVLHIQGDICAQPVVDEFGNILLWNGEIFGMADGVAGPRSGENDTRWILGALASLSGPEEISVALSHVHGPFAIIYYCAASRRVFFGRDPFGRRSLLTCFDNNEGTRKIVAISSVALIEAPVRLCWAEVSVEGIYSFLLGGGEIAADTDCVLTRWPESRLRLTRRPIASPPDVREEENALKFLNVCRGVLRRRMSCIRSSIGVGVLFSGGIDSVFLAALLHECLSSELPIELINVTFTAASQERSPDRLAAVAAVVELSELFPAREWRLVHVDVEENQQKENKEKILQLIHPRSTQMDLNIGSAFFFAARGEGGYLRSYTSQDRDLAYSACVGGGRPLLRSGGEGAARAVGLERWPSLDDGHAEQRGVKKPQPCPAPGCKRIAKPSCLNKQCSQCCPGCNAHRHKQSHVATRVDVFDIEASALPDPVVPPVPYSPTSKILLVGIGADEQLAGYGRHRTAFTRGHNLEAELCMDMERLHLRNLGRDDRCISSSGRESWFPFLDEHVVGFLQTLTLAELCDLSLAPGEGDKMLLREAARKIGLQKSATLVKRAVQFGSGAAKQTSRLESGRRGKGIDSINI